MLVLLAGCTTRSISDSGYSPSRFYKGELTELDILGVAPKQEATEENFKRALETAVPPKLRRGDKLILIQSGAPIPDTAMLEETTRYFSVAPFSGIPPEEKGAFSDSLRLRAAQGGYRYLVCYWGMLESAQQEREGKAVSWVPIVGSFIPDQKQQMRISLKALVLDVGTGGWKMLTSKSYHDASFSSDRSRESTDQQLVLALKTKSYRNLVEELLKE
jgi:hypothetical protein